jgi:hypothetical protein
LNSNANVSLTADTLASRFYSERPRDGWLSQKQTEWLIDRWMHTPITNRHSPPHLSAAGTLLDVDGAALGRWELTQNRMNRAGRIHYVLTSPLC